MDGQIYSDDLVTWHPDQFETLQSGERENQDLQLFPNLDDNSRTLFVEPGPWSLMDINLQQPGHFVDSTDSPIPALHQERVEDGYIRKRYACVYPGCTTTCGRTVDLRRHMMTVHGRKLSCRVCRHVFNGLEKLVTHVQNEHFLQVSSKSKSDNEACESTTSSIFFNRWPSDCSGLNIDGMHESSQIPPLHKAIPSYSSEIDLVDLTSIAEDFTLQLGESSRSDSPSWESKLNLPESPRKSTPENSLYFGATKSRLPESNRQRLLQCPYNKHDPGTYNGIDYRPCALAGFSSISRLKEHIYRRHRASPQCQRCGAEFKTEYDLRNHLQHPMPCEHQLVPRQEGITAVLEQRLKSRRKTKRDQSVEETWQEIYKLLFPDDDARSPFFEPVQPKHTHPIDSTGIPQHHHEFAGVEAYQQYMRRESPQLFSSLLEAAANRQDIPLEEESRVAVVSIFRECLDQVIENYKPAVITATDDEQLFSDAIMVDSLSR